MNIETHLPWLLSVITLTQLWITGNMHRHAWTLGLANQALWFTWIFYTKNWGFLPMNIGLCFVMFRNHRKWKQT